MSGKPTKIPENLRYTADHEWVLVEGKTATIGITDYAQDALTDVVFAELPEVGDAFKPHDSMGVVESVKSVSDIFAPLGCTITAVNDALADAPELMNQDPYGKGWFVKVALTHPDEVAKLLTAAQYRDVLAKSGH